MGGHVYLKTNKSEVKLEGIKFKPKDFEHLCKMDFLFPDGKVWDHPPIVGIDVMRHPRDPSILLVLLCFGVGCVILRFVEGKPVPAPIVKFLSDKRIHFVGFGIPEKRNLFPFEELELSKSKTDVGYLAAKILKQPKCKKMELSELARKILGIKKMVGLTDASSSQRHEKIKCAICQLFVTSVVAMALLRVDDKKKPSESPQKKSPFLKNLNSFHSFADKWFKGKKKGEDVEVVEETESVNVHIGEADDLLSDEDFVGAESPFSTIQLEGDEGEECDTDNDRDVDDSYTRNVQLKGILKCPSTRVQNSDSLSATPKSALKRANSKGCNVRFEDE